MISRDLFMSEITTLSAIENRSVKEDYLLSCYEMALIISDSLTASSVKNEYITLADVFLKYNGTKEYDGIVSVIQNWFYGSLVKAPWCGTSVCWGLAQLGLYKYTLSGKSDNVYTLNTLFTESSLRGKITKIRRDDEIKRGDIVVLCFDNVFSTTANKHITVCLNSYDDSIECIGGNQNHSICRKYYDKSSVFSVFRPHYEKETVRKVELLPDA